MSAADAHRDPVEELAEEFARRLRRGERPSLSEYTARHPELAAEIRDLFPALVVMEQFGSVADPAAPPPARSAPPPRLGDFRIVREVGRGGMGVVYEAVQESLGRHVALKVLPAGGPAGPHRERFRREAKAAAKLHHTNIVPVFAVGGDGDTLYYAMQFIRGQGLDAVLAEVLRLRADGTATHAAPASGLARRLLTGQLATSRASGPVSPRPESAGGAAEGAPLADSGRGDTVTTPTTGDLAAQPEARYYREVARLGVQAAEALHHAHQQGVLHRDVKPSNLLLDATGTLWVTDFGLAKAADSDDLTGTGDLVGTLRYMAPERFRGKADARSDVYSLAVTLYELLTLRPAYDDTDRLKVIDRIGRDDPPRVRLIAPDVPRDLETVIHKALARAPADRYATAQAFADDLRRFLDGRPILARRHRLAEQAWRWCRRNPAVAALAGAVLALLVAVAAVSTAAAVRLGAALKTANDNLTRAVSAETDADANRWRSHLLDARASRLSRAPGQRFAALASLRQAVEIARGRGMPPEWVAEMRTEAIAALALPDVYVERWWAGRPAGSMWLSFTADLATYARVEGDGAVSVRRVEDDAELHRLPPLGGPVRTRLSPDGRSLFVYQFQAAPPVRGRLWDLTARPPVVRAEMSDLDVYFGCSYRPDGRLVAVAHAGGSISVYDPATGRRLHRLAPDAAVREVGLALHPAAPLVAVSSYFCRDVCVRDLKSGAVVARLTPPWAGGGFATWHPSGRALCVGHGDGQEVRVYDFDPATHVFTYRRSVRANTGGGTGIVLDPTGDRAVVYGWGGTVSLVDFPAGRVLFEAPAGFASWPQFDPAGRALAAAAQQDTTKVGIWSVADGRECRVLVHGRQNMMRWPAASPDGRVVAVNFADGLLLVDPATGRELATVPFRPGTGGMATSHVGSYEFEPSGALLTNSWDGCFRWPLRPDPSAPGRLLLGPPERLPFHEGIGAIAAGRDGRVVAQVMDTGYGMGAYAGGWIVHPDHPDRPRRVLAGTRGSMVAVSPDGRWVAFGLHDSNGIHVVESATGHQVWETTGTTRSLFTPDGRWLVTDADGGRVYAVGTWAPGPQLGPGYLYCVSADGRLAVFGTTDGTYRLAEVETGREVVRLHDPDHHSGYAALTPDGGRLVALTSDGLRVWDLRLIRRELAELGLDWDTPPLPPEPPSTPPVEVRLVGAELLDPEVRTWWALAESSLRLWSAPDDLAARLHRADAARAVGWLRLPEYDYTLALDRQSDHRTARFQRGLIRLRTGRPADALADFDDLVRRDPNDYAARYRQALALAHLGRFTDAASAFDPIVARYPEDSTTIAFRGLCRERAGDEAGAATDFERVRELLEDPATADNHLAWMYLTAPGPLRDPARALPLSRAAVERSPTRWTYHNTLGVALYRLGRYGEAVTPLTASLEHAAESAAAWDLYVLAMCHYRLGDAARARDCFDRAVRWRRDRQLSAREAEELDEFRAEATRVLAGP